MEAHQYVVNVAWSQQRKGTVCSPELTESMKQNGCIEVATPPEFPQGMPGIWSPEHLFTASVASCLMTTFLAIAENSKLDYTSFACKAIGTLEKTDKGFAMTKVHLEPVVTINDESAESRAMRVLEKSEQHCLITKSIQSEVTMEPKVEIQQGAVEVS